MSNETAITQKPNKKALSRALNDLLQQANASFYAEDIETMYYASLTNEVTDDKETRVGLYMTFKNLHNFFMLLEMHTNPEVDGVNLL